MKETAIDKIEKSYYGMCNILCEQFGVERPKDVKAIGKYFRKVNKDLDDLEIYKKLTIPNLKELIYKLYDIVQICAEGKLKERFNKDELYILEVIEEQVCKKQALKKISRGKNGRK